MYVVGLGMSIDRCLYSGDLNTFVQAFNSLSQSPCEVAAYLFYPCVAPGKNISLLETLFNPMTFSRRRQHSFVERRMVLHDS